MQIGDNENWAQIGSPEPQREKNAPIQKNVDMSTATLTAPPVPKSNKYEAGIPSAESHAEKLLETANQLHGAYGKLAQASLDSGHPDNALQDQVNQLEEKLGSLVKETRDFSSRDQTWGAKHSDAVMAATHGLDVGSTLTAIYAMGAQELNPLGSWGSFAMKGLAEVVGRAMDPHACTIAIRAARSGSTFGGVSNVAAMAGALPPVNFAIGVGAAVVASPTIKNSAIGTCYGQPVEAKIEIPVLDKESAKEAERRVARYSQMADVSYPGSFIRVLPKTADPQHNYLYVQMGTRKLAEQVA